MNEKSISKRLCFNANLRKEFALLLMADAPSLNTVQICSMAFQSKVELIR